MAAPFPRSSVIGHLFASCGFPWSQWLTNQVNHSAVSSWKPVCLCVTLASHVRGSRSGEKLLRFLVLLVLLVYSHSRGERFIAVCVFSGDFVEVRLFVCGYVCFLEMVILLRSV